MAHRRHSDSSGAIFEVHRSDDRRYTRVRNQENWLTFDPDGGDRPSGACEALENVIESRWGPEASARAPIRTGPMDLITYVRAGRIDRTDAGGSRVLEASDFERTRVGPGDECVDTNPSKSHFSHAFQIFLRAPDPHVECPAERKSFPEADRKGRVVVVASPDDDGGLLITQDVRIFSTLLYPGERVDQGLEAHRSVWVHVAHGVVSLGDAGDLVLRKGDSASVEGAALRVTAREHSELLIIDCARTLGDSGT